MTVNDANAVISDEAADLIAGLLWDAAEREFMNDGEE
jgi:hypothetical protein